MKKSIVSAALALVVTSSLVTPLWAASGIITSSGSDKFTEVTYVVADESGDTETKPDTSGEVQGTPFIVTFDGKTLINPGFSNADKVQAFTYPKLSDGKMAMMLSYQSEAYFDSNFFFQPKFATKSGFTTDHKYIRITYMTTDTVANKISMVSNDKRVFANIVNDTSVSEGEFVRSKAVNIDVSNIMERFGRDVHCTLQYSSTDPNSKIYIREIAFFTSKEQAYSYYGEEVQEDDVTYSKLTFGTGSNSGFWSNDPVKMGTYTVNTQDNTVDITYGPIGEKYYTNYIMMPKFSKAADYNPDHKYIRVLYSAKNPTGVDEAKMFLKNNGKWDGSGTVCLEDSVVNTNGEFVLSDTVRLCDNLAERFGNGMHCTLMFNTAVEGGEYRIKEIYFFGSRAAAESFVLESNIREVTIKGNDISKYQIVIAKDAVDDVKSAATILANKIRSISGFDIKVVTDDTAESPYEILVGTSSRAKSAKLTSTADKYYAKYDGNTLIINSGAVFAIYQAAERYVNGYLSGGGKKPLALTDSHSFEESIISLKPVTMWNTFTNSGAPTQFTEDFSVDSGYFTEDNGKANWSYNNGTMSTDAKELALSYIHVYEPDVSYSAKLMYKKNEGGSFGLVARHTADEALIKAGYDFTAGEWYIENRIGSDFFPIRLASAKAAIAPDTWYSLKLTVDDKTAVLTVNGAEVLRTDGLIQMTPGRVGVYAENAFVAVDDVDLTLLSGEGTIWKNVTHNILNPDTYMEGGSVVELTDGSVAYAAPSYVKFGATSKDNGATWSTSNTNFATVFSHPCIIRLANGDLMGIKRALINGTDSVICQTSSDDGKTWVSGGVICTYAYEGDADYRAITMNDKMFQSPSTGRIFLNLAYEHKKANTEGVFVITYYSDDNGKTWTAGVNSRDIEGNINEKQFSETVMVECADGTLRMYSTWNEYDTIVYSESKDNGVTWGNITEMPGFDCAKSSIGIARDPYAENDSTYYMVWVNSKQDDDSLNSNGAMSRSRLTVAKTTDGKNFTVLGDAWRWESPYYYGSAHINHVVDPFISVSKDHIYVGAGLSEAIDDGRYHHAQRQHIWSVPKADIEIGEKLYDFTDVTTKDASYEAFKFCVDKGLFNGTSATTMGPKVTVSRAMFAAVLGRLNGADMTKYTTPTFKDVVAGQWYTSSVEWAAANSVITGYPGGVYGINDPVTVEQACLILARYNGFKAGNSGKTLSDFTDSASVSTWAADGVKWAVESGVYNGKGELLNPTSPASREMMAEMMWRYSTIFGK